MSRYKVLNQFVAIVLIISITNSMLIGGSMAAVVSVFQFSALTGVDAAEAISRETRLRLDSRVGNSVDAGSGAFRMESSILSLEGGRRLDFNLFYDSLLTGSQGPMGYGWSHGYETFIEGDPEGMVTIHWDANRRNSFSFVQSNEPYAPLDEAVTYEKLILRNDGTWKLTQLDGTQYEFAASGDLTRVGNKVNQYLELERTDGLLTSIRETIGGKEIFLNYTSDNNALLQSITDPLERVYYFAYDSDLRLSAIFDPTMVGPEQGEPFAPKNIPDGDPGGLIHTIVVSDDDPIGLVELTLANISHSQIEQLTVTLTSPEGTTAVLHDQTEGPPNLSFDRRVLDNFEGENPEGRWNIQIVDSQSGTAGSLNGWIMRFSSETNGVRYSYDPNNRLTLARGPDGEQLFSNNYDSQGRVSVQDDGVPTNQVARIEYEELNDGVRTTYWNRLGHATVMEHDGQYRLTSVTDPLGNTSNWDYNSNGDRVRSTDALGRTTVFNYDSNGNLITFVDPAGSVSIFEHETFDNNVTTIRDALGKETRFTYDNNNNLTRIRDALGNEDNKSYNSNSQMTSNLLAGRGGIDIQYTGGKAERFGHPAENGNVESEYDDAGRLTKVTDLDGFSTTMKYSLTDQIIEQTDPLGHTVISEHDRRDRLIRKVDPRGNETRFTYDDNGNLTSMTDALSRVTLHGYDGEDRVIRTVDSQGAVSTVTYDAAGRSAGKQCHSRLRCRGQWDHNLRCQRDQAQAGRL